MLVLRGKAPDVCLAQPNGLGKGYTIILRAKGPAVCPVSKVVRWAKSVERSTSNFKRQSGYGAFSVSHSLYDVVDQYIRNQAKHHEKMFFKEEYLRNCDKHEIDIDEVFVRD